MGYDEFLDDASASGASWVQDEDRIVDELKRLRSEKGLAEPVLHALMTTLKETKSARIRNAAAITLADLKAKGSKKLFVDLLSRPETRGERGTLFYALELLNAKIPLRLLIETIIQDEYEARQEALGFLEEQKFIRRDFKIPQAAEALRRALLAHAGEERMSDINAALSYLEGLAPA